jgi:hypothetical protein
MKAAEVTVVTTGNSNRSPNALIAEEVSLGLLGARELAPALLAENITWQNGESSVIIGRSSVKSAVKLKNLRKVQVEDIVTHGMAAAVSGRLFRDDHDARLFCHMIKFTSASAQEIASIVSFEHRLKGENNDQRTA